MLDIDKMNSIIKDRLEQYRLYEDEIKKLELLKNCENKNTDINSWIKSKNKTSDKTGYSAISNIEIERKIKENIKWKTLIDEVIKFYEKDNKLFASIIKNKFYYHLPEKYNIDFSGVSKSTYYRYLQIIYCQIGINAFENKLIDKNNLKYDETI